VLHSSCGESRSIIVALPAGEELAEHRVRENSHVVMVRGEAHDGPTSSAIRWGIVAQQLAVDAPDRVRRLVLVWLGMLTAVSD
jgi:hypothetical protein